MEIFDAHSTHHNFLSQYSPESHDRTLEIHLRTLTLNGAHPLSCAGSILRYTPPNANDPNLFDRRLGPWVIVQICGPHLGVMVFSENHEETEEDDGEASAHLVVWNWTSGQRVAVSEPRCSLSIAPQINCGRASSGSEDLSPSPS